MFNQSVTTPNIRVMNAMANASQKVHHEIILRPSFNTLHKLRLVVLSNNGI
jgi:hypothetical protein